MSEVLSQPEAEVPARAEGSGLFTDESTARMTAAFGRAVTKARAEDLMLDRLEFVEQQVESLKAEVREAKKREDQLRLVCTKGSQSHDL